jgi:hypothetical protein
MTTNGKKKPVSILVGGSDDLLPEDLYLLRFRKFSTKPMEYGEGLIFEFTVVKGDHAGREVTGMVTRKEPLTPKSKEWVWIKALLGREPMDGENVTEDVLVGKEALGMIVQVVKRAGTYNRVDKLMPINKGR